MDFRSFNNELSLAQIQFMSIFSGIVISRDVKNGKSKDIIVPCVAGQRSRIIKNLENPDMAVKQPLPIIVIERGGFSRDTERVANLHLEQKLSPRADMLDLNLISPNPINISYTVSVLTKYPGDMDKIISNFLPFFNGDVYVKMPHPKIKDSTLKCQVLWGGTVNQEWQSELGNYIDDIQVMSMEFTFKTYLFGGQGLSVHLSDGGKYNDTDWTIKTIGGKAFVNFVNLFNSLPKTPDGYVDLNSRIHTCDNPDGCTNIDTCPYQVSFSADYAEIEKILKEQCPDGIFELKDAEYLDEKYKDGVFTGSIFLSVPTIYTSCEEYYKEFKEGKHPNAQYDTINVVRADDINKPHEFKVIVV